MKKSIFLCIGIAMLSLAGCSKNYTCEYSNGVKQQYSSDYYSDQDIESVESLCISQGGSWK